MPIPATPEAPGTAPTAQAPPATGFDVQGAQKAGYSDDEILQHLTASRKFDVAGAVNAGYSKQDIINHLSSTPAPSGHGSSGSWTPNEGPVTRFAKGVGEQLNPVTMVKGVANMVAHPSDTLAADAEARGKMQEGAKEDFHQGSYMKGVVRTLESLVPLLGPQLQQAADKIDTGDVAGGLGSSAGLGLSMKVPSLMGDAAKGIAKGVATKAGATAENMYRGALKPSTTMAPGKATKAVRTGLEEGIPISETGAAKRQALVEDIEGQKNAAIQKAGPEPVIDPASVASSTDPLRARLQKQVNPTEDVQALDASKKEFLDQHPNKLSLQEAQAIKQGTDRQLNRKSAYGELKTANVETQKYLVGGLREAIAKMLPEVKDANARQGALIELGPELERAVSRNLNKGNGPGLAAGLTGASVGMVTGSHGLAAASAAIKAMFDNPSFRSKLAIQLNKASKGDVSIPEARARIAGYAAVLAPDDSRASQ